MVGRVTQWLSIGYITIDSTDTLNGLTGHNSTRYNNMKDITQIRQLDNATLRNYINMGLVSGDFIKRSEWETIQTIFRELGRAGVTRLSESIKSRYYIVGRAPEQYNYKDTTRLLRILKQQSKFSLMLDWVKGVLNVK